MTGPDRERSPLERALALSRWIAWGTAALGLVVLAGWFSGVESLKSVLPGLVTMKANAAAGFVLAGLALRMALATPPIARGVGVGMAVLLLLLGVVTLAQVVFGFDARIDSILVEDDTRAVDTPSPGRMAPAVALGFVFLAGSLLSTRRAAVCQTLALATFTIGIVGMLGHFYGAEPFFRAVASGSAMALHTSVGLVAVAVGALFVRADSGLSAALVDPSHAGDELRRLMPAAFAIPVFLGAVALAGYRADLWDPGFRTALLSIGTILALLGLAFLSYTSLRRSETERLVALASLAQSESRYRSTFDSVTIGLAHAAPDGRWLRVNQRLCEMLGYTDAELREKTYAEVSHLEDLELDVRQWELLRRGEIEDYGTERRFVTKEGEEVHADVKLVREEDPAGNLLHFIAVIQDITGRKLSEGTLRVYERALAATQNGIVMTDATKEDHPIVFVNPAFLEITGYDQSEVLGRNCRFLNVEARNQAALGEVRRAVESGTECSVLLRNQRKDGAGFWNQLSIAPVHDADGALTHFVGVIVDATERVEALAERDELLESAEAAIRERDRFLSVVSHELRSPLNAVLAWTSILRDETGPENLARAVTSIDSAVHSQTRLVDDLLEVARIRAGTLEVEPVRAELGAVVQRAVEQAIPQATEKEIALELDTPATAIYAIVDPERIAQVLRNLIDNALKFTPEGGRIGVTLADAGADCRIEVRDTGRGIPADVAPRLFDEFWQADRKGTSGGKGLGLGLSIVKHLVERHGGGVEAESEGTDRGARFSIALPKVGPSGTPRQEQEGEPGGSPLAGVEIVVVDDDEATVRALAAALGKAGAIPKAAVSVSEALLHFERGAPEILVSDIGLPDRDGFDLIRAVRAMGEPARSIPAVAVTGLASREERRRIQRAGFDGYLAKPVEAASVVDRLASLRAAQTANTPASRRVLVVGDPAGTRELGERLRKLGHVTREAADGPAALRAAADFEPHLILILLPIAGTSPSTLAERLAAGPLHAPLVGILELDSDADLKPFDFVLGTPIDEPALERLLLFGVLSS